MLIGDNSEGVLSPEEHGIIWKKYLTLPQHQQDVLTDVQMAVLIKRLQEEFSLSDSIIRDVSLRVRKIIFNELDLFSCEKELRSLFVQSGEDQNKIGKIVAFLDKEILHLVPKSVPEEEDVQKKINIVRFPLLKAMGEYRHLSEQLLTNEKIKLKTSMEPVRPSLGNWLRSYREELGIGFHETAQRGNFLFQSVNCKRLSNDDRARLNLILKSVEEDFPLEIDTTHETIIFPRTDDTSMELAQVKTQPMNRTIRPRVLPENPAVAAPNIRPTAPIVPVVSAKSHSIPTFKPLFGKTAAPEKNVSGETLHFSTGHVLPAEQEVGAVPTGINEALRQMQHPTQGIRREPKAPLSKSPYSIRPLRARNGGNGDI